jgi:hypothetical protein
MKLWKKILMILSIIPVLWFAFYFFIQQPNFCTREYSWNWNYTWKDSFCKITDDYLKIHKPEAMEIVKSYEYAYFNEEYNKVMNGNIFPIDRQLLLFQDSWYWNDVYDNVKNNLENDAEYRETLLWFLEYWENINYRWKGWDYSIKWNTYEEQEYNRLWFKSSLNNTSENLIKQVETDMQIHKRSDFSLDIIQFICIILALIWITFFSIKIIKYTKSILSIFLILVFDSIILCCCFDMFNGFPDILQIIINVLLGIMLVWISAITISYTITNKSMNLFEEKNYSDNYNNILWILKLLVIIGISIFYIAWINNIIFWYGNGIWASNWSVWIDVFIANMLWFGFDIYISVKLIKYIKCLNIKKIWHIVLIILVIVALICKCMTIFELYVYEVVLILSILFCTINFIIYIPWANSKLIKLSKYLLNLAPKTLKKLNDETNIIFE